MFVLCLLLCFGLCVFGVGCVGGGFGVLCLGVVWFCCCGVFVFVGGCWFCWVFWGLWFWLGFCCLGLGWVFGLVLWLWLVLGCLVWCWFWWWFVLGGFGVWFWGLFGGFWFGVCWFFVGVWGWFLGLFGVGGGVGGGGFGLGFGGGVFGGLLVFGFGCLGLLVLVCVLFCWLGLFGGFGVVWVLVVLLLWWLWE